MNSTESNKPVVQSGTPTWSERDQFLKVQRWFRVLIAVVVILWLLLIGWVFFVAPIAKAEVSKLETGANLSLVLAPVIVAAAAVERTLESVFNVIEGSWHTLVAYLGRGLRWLKSAEVEVKQARQFLAEASDKYNMEMQSLQIGQTSVSAITDTIRVKMEAANKMMTLAQKRLTDAESNLDAVTSSDSYISAKAAVSIVLGLMLGVVIAAIGQLQMFAMLGIAAVPARFDVFVTGLVIGSGSYPVHSLVGILQQGKDTLDSAKGYFNRLSPAVKTETTTVPPTAPGESLVVETTTAKTTDEGPHK
ncbi:MAG: hypothetical protein HYR70_01515 [Chloroflexi bacterium]|nr:hypothetical protein [Chloroflexota bacterium]MBI3341200.1 hypothetical protein [Chloroflexota bacterium]